MLFIYLLFDSHVKKLRVDMSASIPALRRELQSVLGTNYTRYLVVMRDWFSNKHNRQDWEFDMPFLTGRAKDLHNALMKSILHLCMSSDFETRHANSLENFQYFTITSGRTSIKSNSLSNVITLHSVPAQDSSTPSFGMSMEIENDNHIQSIQSTSFDEIECDGDGEDPVGLVEDEQAAELGTKQMFTIHITKVREDEADGVSLPATTKLDRRLPISFIKDFVGLDDEFYSVVPNVTHFLKIDKYLQRNPDQAKFFKSRTSNEKPYLTNSATIPEKFLLRVWARGLKSVHPDAVKLVMRATREHIIYILRELIKRRKSYNFDSDGHLHIGEPHQNPYLLSAHHVPRCGPKMPYVEVVVDPVTVPPKITTLDKSEQQAALKAATSMEKESRYSSKIGVTELLELAKAEPHLFPNIQHRFHILENCLLKSKGYFESPIYQSPEEEIEFQEEEGELLPLCSY